MRGRKAKSGGPGLRRGLFRVFIPSMAEKFKLDLTERPRRLRRTAALRALVRETALAPSDFIAPLFVVEGRGAPQPVPSMPGVSRLSIAGLVAECRALLKLGVPAVAIFPKLDSRLKDDDGTAALDEDGLVVRAVRAVKKSVPGMVVMTDLALDPYTTHGHDGVLTAARDDIENDRTVDILTRMAVLHARAGVDLVAPSDMMDGRVGAIRRALDAAGFEGTGIMAYAAKFASAYYGPFRDAVGTGKAGAAGGPPDKASSARVRAFGPTRRTAAKPWPRRPWMRLREPTS